MTESLQRISQWLHRPLCAEEVKFCVIVGLLLPQRQQLSGGTHELVATAATCLVVIAICVLDLLTCLLCIIIWWLWVWDRTSDTIWSHTPNRICCVPGATRSIIACACLPQEPAGNDGCTSRATAIHCAHPVSMQRGDRTKHRLLFLRLSPRRFHSAQEFTCSLTSHNQAHVEEKKGTNKDNNEKGPSKKNDHGEPPKKWLLAGEAWRPPYEIVCWYVSNPQFLSFMSFVVNACGVSMIKIHMPPFLCRFSGNESNKNILLISPTMTKTDEERVKTAPRSTEKTNRKNWG